MNTPLIRATAITRWSAVLLVLPVLILAGCASPTPIPLNPTRTPRPTRTPLPQGTELPTATPDSGKVSAGDYEVYMRCIGEGSPAVIIEADVDQPGTSSNWGRVSREIGFTTRTCSYDRANLGRSDKVDGVRTSENIAADLHSLLENAEIEGPYILVGHQVGSWHVRLFAQQYPEDVLGIVLVQPTHPDELARFVETLPPVASPELEMIRLHRDWWGNPNAHFLESDEHFDYVTSAGQVRETGPFGDLPIIIVSIDPTIVDEDPLLPANIDAEVNRIRHELQVEQLTLSTNSEHWIAEGVEFVVQEEEPQVIVDAVLALIERVR